MNKAIPSNQAESESFMTATFQAVADIVGAVVPEHLVASAEIPVTMRAIQGDVMIRPADDLIELTGGQPIPVAGVNLVTEDIGRERHILSADPDSGVLFAPSLSTSVAGWITVPEGAVAYITHTGEHGSVALEGGHNYEVRVQTDPYEQARSAD